MDRISNLPDELLCHVGSFLSTKETAFTTVLSKRWRNLFTIIQSLHFDASKDNGESFTDFVDRVSSLPENSRVMKLSLKLFDFEDEPNQYYDHINTCLRHVLKRGVLVLDLRVNGEEGYSLPFEVFTCKTLTKLVLGSNFAIDSLPNKVFLPSLKTLFLNYVMFYEFGGNCAFQTVLAASPVLEELSFHGVDWEHWRWSHTVSSSSLKRLIIRRMHWDEYYHESDFRRISFDTPSLVYLYYSDYAPKEYLDVNLNSLVEATLDLYPRKNLRWTPQDAIRFHITNLLHGLKNVEILNFNIFEALEMFRFFHEALPVFEKLSHLSVVLSNSCWFSLKVILRKSPNLKTLTINGSLHYRGFEPRSVCYCVSEYSFLVSCPLEVLKITKYYGSEDELTQMEYILGKLTCLELVEIHSQLKSEFNFKIESDLQKLPRASSKCKFKVVK